MTMMIDRWMADAATLVKEDTGVNAIILVNHGYLEQNPVVMVRFDDIEVFVSISDKPEIIDNPQVDIPVSEVMDWVKLNKELLLEYWDDDLYPTSKMIKNIQKVETVDKCLGCVMAFSSPLYNSFKNLIDSSSYSESPQNLFTLLLPSFTRRPSLALGFEGL